MAAAVASTVVGVYGTPAASGQEARERPITFEVLADPDGSPLLLAHQVNDRGQVTAFGADNQPYVWEDGTATQLSPPGAGNYLPPKDISERGRVVGVRHTGIPLYYGFTWDDGDYVELASSPVATLPSPNDVNGHGVAVGVLADLLPAAWDDDGTLIETLPELGQANEANDQGLVAVTQIVSSTRQAAVWQIGGDVTPLPDLGPSGSRALAINERGDVAGEAQTEAGTTHAVLWRDGEAIDLGTLGGAHSRVGTSDFFPGLLALQDLALNERGAVVGTSDTATGASHAFLWRDGAMVDLGTLGGAASRASAVNRHGQVVGAAQVADGTWHAFVWSDGVMHDLGDLVGPGASDAIDINDQGQVTGYVDAGTGTPSEPANRAVLWDVPRHIG